MDAGADDVFFALMLLYKKVRWVLKKQWVGNSRKWEKKRCKSGGENLKGTKRCKETNEKKHLRGGKGMLGGKNADWCREGKHISTKSG